MILAILFLFILFIEMLAFAGLFFLTAVAIITTFIDFIAELKD
jgi:hypothetical protein